MTLLCSFSGTGEGPSSLRNLFCFKGWSKDLHLAGCMDFLLLNLGLVQLVPHSFSWLMWSQPQAVLTALLEKQDRGDTFTRGWIPPCSARGIWCPVCPCRWMDEWMDAWISALSSCWHSSTSLGTSAAGSTSRAKFSQLKWVSVSAAGICPWKSAVLKLIVAGEAGSLDGWFGGWSLKHDFYSSPVLATRLALTCRTPGHVQWPTVCMVCLKGWISWIKEDLSIFYPLYLGVGRVWFGF